uniref:Fc receptor-like protein 5 n=1 Tax=Sander lucioperca TaxID=283035 RepID=A0A8C9ZJ14_SANLU
MKAILLFLLLFSTCQTSILCQVFVTIPANRSQYFEYEKMSVGCGDWTAWRYTTDGLKLSQCALGWGDKVSSNCNMKAVKLSDSGVYWCQSKHGDSSHTVNITVTDDSAPASLTASPKSSQLFEYKKLSLNCGDHRRLHGWKIFRATSSNAKSFGKMSSCGDDWGVPTSTGCELHAAKQDDSAIYWCESPGRQRSNSLDISFHDKPVILESPVVPVMAGQEVPLRCSTKQSSNLSALFYKDGLEIETKLAGQMTIRRDLPGHVTILRVSTSHEGLYKCHISGVGESSASWLFVRAAQSNTTKPPSPVYPSQLMWTVIRHLVVAFPYCIATILMLCTCAHRPKGRNQLVSMEMCPPSEDDEARGRDYDDVTIEHHF